MRTTIFEIGQLLGQLLTVNVRSLEVFALAADEPVFDKIWKSQEVTGKQQ